VALGCQNSFMGVEDNVSKQLKPLFEDPPEWSLPQEQKDEIYKAQSKVKGLKEVKPLPEGYSTHIDAPWRHVYTKDGHLLGGTQSAFLAHNGEQVGEVRWNPLTGHVNWLGVHPDHRVIGTHHLLNAAHEWAAKEGGLGPFRSDSLSEHSASLMKRFVPSSIPSGAYLPPRRGRASYYDTSVHESPYADVDPQSEHDFMRAANTANNILDAIHSISNAQGVIHARHGDEIPVDHPDFRTANHLASVHLRLRRVRNEVINNRSNYDLANEDGYILADEIEEHPSYDHIHLEPHLKNAVESLRANDQ
jgi:GNAT superfamily N-acetyltransferase